jgi:lon-related putative ATP-dependent protease
MKDIDTSTNLKGIIGQKRAVKALRFGLCIHQPGFNIFVSGPPGIGKMTAVESYIEVLAKKRKTPSDWCYVNNFEDPYQPKAIEIQSGKGREFQQDIKKMTDHFWQEFPKIFEGDDYISRSDQIMKNMNKQRETRYYELNNFANQNGFALQPSTLGIRIIPVLQGKQLKDDEFQSIPEKQRKKILSKRDVVQEELKRVLKKIGELEKTARDKIEELDEQVVLLVVETMINELKEKYEGNESIIDFFDKIQEDILVNINILKAGAIQTGSETKQSLPFQTEITPEMIFKTYQVNLIVDNSKTKGAPVVVQLNSSFHNLFGKIEKETELGNLITDFTMIRPGCIHNANGGYLVLAVEDLLNNIYSYEAIKRALQTNEIQIEDLSERLGYTTTKSLKPQPISLDVKVVLVGAPDYYYLMYSHDVDFSHLFKVKADFDTTMDATKNNIKEFVVFLKAFAKREKLSNLTGNAVSKVLEYSARSADDQGKISTKFGTLTDLLREANYWSKEDNKKSISAEHIQKALNENIYRSKLIDDKIKELIEDGSILIDTHGKKVGQINGLVVYDLGDYSFGKPNRIDVNVGVGRAGIIDIEREVQLGGPIHSKGVMILNGFLTQKFAHDKPLSLSAHLVFEQSYDGVEGDSASSAELYLLLSALSDLPINQSIAVTGSVNQKGEVQAIGGVNEKIEGYYDVCKLKGFNGSEGVIIPKSNVRNLMLREDVVKAVKDNKFKISPGKKKSDGEFTKNSFYDRVNRKLKEFRDVLLRCDKMRIEGLGK